MVTPVSVVVQASTFTPAPLATPIPAPTVPASATPEPALISTATPLLLPTPDGLTSTRRVRLPIFMYHYVEPWAADADQIRQGLTVKPEDFAAQIKYLHDHGYVTVSLYDLMDALALGTPLPDKAVVLTFDDGYRSLVDYAAPELKQYGYTGMVFVITELMDRELPLYLTWSQAEALYAQGWKIEPHTKTHEELAGQSRDFQLYEILGSMQTIQAHIGVLPRFLCYPSGKYDDVTLQLDREVNLWGAVTVEFGRVHTLADQYTLTRVRVDGRGTLQDFINALEGDLQS